MIPMSCPSCGRRGNVPLDRLNTRMHCKKCDAVFHLDASGKPVIGEPPPPKGSKAAKGARDANEPLDPIGIVAEKLSHTPKPIWMTGAVLLGGYLLWTVGTWLLTAGPASAQQSTAVMVKAVTEAFLTRDMATLKRMAAAGTEEDMVQLVEIVRPVVGDGGSTTEGILPAQGEPQLLDENNMVVDVSLLPAGGGSSYTLRLAWSKDVKGRWAINGRSTLEVNKTQVEQMAAAKAKDKGKGKRK